MSRMAHTSQNDALGGDPDRPRTLIDRVRRAERIAQLRATGYTWEQVSHDVGLSVRASQRAYADLLNWGPRSDIWNVSWR